MRFLNALLFSLLFLSSAAFALELDTAKSTGLVGETSGGYLESVVDNPSKEVKELINEINSKRKTKYSEIATSRGTSLSAVEKLAGEKAIESTSRGNYVKTPDGVWIRK